MSVGGATAVGFCAVILWSLLAPLTALSGRVPPFQLVAMSFATAALLGLFYLARTGAGIASLRKIPSGAWVLGVGGLFGYHFFYFLALRSAPAVEANLINYLWPLLIVLFSGLLNEVRTGGGLRWWHLAGAALGFSGTALIVTAGGSEAGPADGRGPWLGYAAALAAALTWSTYSVANWRFARVPTTSVTIFCFATAFLAALSHLAFEATVWPQTPLEWAAAAGLGLGPVGAAFYVWDYGTKHGDIRVLGAAAYAAPLLSTFLLVSLGISRATPSLWLACLLITGGAALAARDMLFRNRA
jgi:drug/metabolite transporter (DMT)-like permease